MWRQRRRKKRKQEQSKAKASMVCLRSQWLAPTLALLVLSAVQLGPVEALSARVETPCGGHLECKPCLENECEWCPTDHACAEMKDAACDVPVLKHSVDFDALFTCRLARLITDGGRQMGTIGHHHHHHPADGGGGPLAATPHGVLVATSQKRGGDSLSSMSRSRGRAGKEESASSLKPEESPPTSPLARRSSIGSDGSWDAVSPRSPAKPAGEDALQSRHPLTTARKLEAPTIPPASPIDAGAHERILLVTVGSRGDVQPFVALGRALMEQIKARERTIGGTPGGGGDGDGTETIVGADPPPVILATLLEFCKFVGDSLCPLPAGTAEPANYCKAGGTMPACFRPVAGTAKLLLDVVIDAKSLLSHEFFWTMASDKGKRDRQLQWIQDVTRDQIRIADDYQPDAIMACPTAWAPMLIAEHLNVPLVHIMFMPWVSTSEFAQPFAQKHISKVWGAIRTSTAPFRHRHGGSHFEDTWSFIQWMTFKGSSTILNEERANLGMELMDWSAFHARNAEIPMVHAFSKALVGGQVHDWQPETVQTTGFIFLDLLSDPSEQEQATRAGIEHWFAAGDTSKVLFIGWGSIADTEDRIRQLTKNTALAVLAAGARAIIGTYGGGLDFDTIMGVCTEWAENKEADASQSIAALTSFCERTFIDVPRVAHDWLFAQDEVRAVVHHGGAGTLAAGLRFGRPTVVVAFMGDQYFWGNIVSAVGAGSTMTSDDLIASSGPLQSALNAIFEGPQSHARLAAQVVRAMIAEEDGVQNTLKFCFDVFGRFREGRGSSPRSGLSLLRGAGAARQRRHPVMASPRSPRSPVQMEKMNRS